MSTATKQDLLKQIEALQQTVRDMGEPKKLMISSECPIYTLHYVNGPTRTSDLNHLDHTRASIRRELAHKLADELMRSGAVKLTETISDDHASFGHRVRIKAELRVC